MTKLEPEDDSETVVVRKITREKLYRLRPDLRPANENKKAKEKRIVTKSD
ncbi:hypothetical protein ABGN05_14700 [Aquibium sp. LZ166]|uniref:Uncharacterized protein n=1 Tax=Aquibium pacificus TaxID=3153579 RepID=A0ABV3SK83_9HYPH